MSELDGNKKLDFSKLDNMSSEELWSILDDDFYLPENEESNADMVLYIMEVLEKRGELVEPKTEMNEIWKKPEPDTVTKLPKRRTGRKVFRFAVSFAAVIALLFMLAVTASAMGVDVFGAIATWTDETFSFKSSGSSSQSAVVQNTKEIPDELSEFAEILDENGLDSQSLLPGYLPEGFICTEIHANTYDEFSSFDCVMQNENSYLIISFVNHFSDRGFVKFQKDAGKPEEYDANGIKYYIMSNMNNYYATYMVNNLECTIYDDLSKDDLLKIIDSI